jgi:dynein intermediate chain
VVYSGQLTVEGSTSPGTPTKASIYTSSVATQTLSTVEVSTNYEIAPTPVTKPETIVYSVGIQTTEPWSQRAPTDNFSDSDGDQSPSALRTPRASKRLSRKARERDDELRRNLRKEIEEELKAVKDPASDTVGVESRFPARTLTDDEMNAVTSSTDFLDFVERSSKVIERALDQDYDVLANYALDGMPGLDEDEDEGYGSSKGRRGRRMKEIAQFYDERWSKKRMISDINFSPKVDQVALPSRHFTNSK